MFFFHRARTRRQLQPKSQEEEELVVRVPKKKKTRRLLDRDGVLSILAKLKEGKRAKIVAKETGRSLATIYKVASGKWRPPLTLGRPPLHHYQKQASKAAKERREMEKMLERAAKVLEFVFEINEEPPTLEMQVDEEDPLV